MQEDESMGESKHEPVASLPIHSQSFLQKLDDFVMLGKTMGYDMTGCIKNVEEIINHHGRSYGSK